MSRSTWRWSSCRAASTMAILCNRICGKVGFSALGERTIYAYLLHGFVIKIADEGLDAYRFDWVQTPAGAVLVTLLAASLAVLLMTAPVTKIFRWAVEPRMPWLFTAQSRRRPQETVTA